MRRDLMKKPKEQKPIILYLEDNEDWAYLFRKDMEEYLGEFIHDIHTISSPCQIDKYLQEVTRQIIIVIDLMLDENKDIRGLDWLENKSECALSRNSRIVYFVLSGFINDTVMAKLVSKGIDQSFIYRKHEYNEKKPEIISKLKYVIKNDAYLSFKNIITNKSGHKIDPLVIELLDHEKTNYSLNDFYKESLSSTQKKISMLIKTGNQPLNDNIVDIEVLSKVGNIYIVKGSMATLLALEHDENVEKIEFGGDSGKFDTDLSLNTINCISIHNDMSEKGDSCIIGIIDSGIDILNDVFMDEHGETRILEIWDQTCNYGFPPKGFTFGHHYDGNRIKELIKQNQQIDGSSIDSNTHGTYVTSIAAGRASNNFFGGVAPEAKIIFVKVKDDCGFDYSSTYLSALKYLKEVSKEYDMPVVINISQGINLTGHDGRSLLERGFDQITEGGECGGLAIVKSAGNERNKKKHAFVKIGNGQSETISWYWSEMSVPHIFPDIIQLWFSDHNLYGFQLVNPSKEHTDIVDINNKKIEGKFADGNYYKITYIPYDPDYFSGKLDLIIKPGDSKSISPGKWGLEMQCNSFSEIGEIDAWISKGSIYLQFDDSVVSQNVTLSVPGTANKVITVGSTSKNNSSYKVSHYSSFGPTRDGRKKPDISAPGENIKVVRKGMINIAPSVSGTSFAAPHVAGSICLLMSYWEKCRQKFSKERLNHNQITKLFEVDSYINNGGEWMKSTGYGRINIKRLIETLNNMYNV